MKDPMLYYQDQIDLWVQERNAETDPGMIKMADELIRELQILNAEFQKVMFAYLVRGVGLTLKAKFAWAVLLPDATHPGKFRYQSFNETGFTGHSTADTAEEVVLEMFKDGYREVDDDVLERLSVSETWQKGMMITDLISQVNRGALSFDEANRQYEELVA